MCQKCLMTRLVQSPPDYRRVNHTASPRNQLYRVWYEDHLKLSRLRAAGEPACAEYTTGSRAASTAFTLLPASGSRILRLSPNCRRICGKWLSILFSRKNRLVRITARGWKSTAAGLSSRSQRNLTVPAREHLAHIGESVEDLVAEVQHEMTEERKHRNHDRTEAKE